jgi:hypothetical protein
MPFDVDGNAIEKDSDLLADLLDEEAAVESGEKDATPAINMDEVNALKAKVDELELARAGLLKAKQAATLKRQSAEDRLAQLEGAVGTILSQRQRQGMESLSESEAAGARKQGIPVSYDDDGNGWIDPNYITQLTSPYAQRINELEAKLQQTSAASSAQSNAQKIMEGIIGEDERFGPASGRYRAARKWVEDKVLDFSQTNGVKRAMTSGEALDHVFSDSFVQKEFEKQFGGIDLADVVTAEDSQSHFRRALRGIAEKLTPKDDFLTTPKDKMDSRFQKVLNKPSSLGNQANAKAGQLSVLDRLNNISTQELMEFSDAQIETLLKLTGKE